MRLVFTLCLLLSFTSPVFAPQAAELKYDRAALQTHWRTRIQGILDQGQLPKIDMETSLQPDHVAKYIPAIFETMDKLGIALLAADGYQRPKDGASGYRWSTYILDLVNAYPARFAPTANGGTNPNWLKEKGGKDDDFIDQMERHVRAGVYAHMGEFDFRHYMSSGQCKKGRTDRDSAIDLTGKNGHRVFRLSAETGVPFVIHMEPEDAPLDQLQQMLNAYPKAKVIVAHFGQVRHPELQKRFTPDNVRKLLAEHQNLYFDLSTGQPNRTYKCAGVDNKGALIGDTVLWKKSANGRQSDTLKSAWRDILSDFSDRFMFATDYGGGRPPLDEHLKQKMENFNRIVRDLSGAAKHDIAYKNAWKLLTNTDWK